TVSFAARIAKPTIRLVKTKIHFDGINAPVATIVHKVTGVMHGLQYTLKTKVRDEIQGNLTTVTTKSGNLDSEELPTGGATGTVSVSMSEGDIAGSTSAKGIFIYEAFGFATNAATAKEERIPEEGQGQVPIQVLPKNPDADAGTTYALSGKLSIEVANNAKAGENVKVGPRQGAEGAGVSLDYSLEARAVQVQWPKPEYDGSRPVLLKDIYSTYSLGGLLGIQFPDHLPIPDFTPLSQAAAISYINEGFVVRRGGKTIRELNQNVQWSPQGGTTHLGNHHWLAEGDQLRIRIDEVFVTAYTPFGGASFLIKRGLQPHASAIGLNVSVEGGVLIHNPTISF
ncbi:MAG: hypothetical protein H7144_05615, partial [Burkholderiales bacterium]|nr:hypothetical protein [Phycisphaerae bacterium]